MASLGIGNYLVLGCLVLAVIASMWVAFFSYRNDFSYSLLQGIYPVAGAAVAALYLLFKLTFVDAPQDRFFMSSIGFIQDTATGRLFAVDPRVTSILSSIAVRSGDQSILDALKSGMAKGRQPGDSMQLDLIEDSILQWLNRPSQWFGYQSKGELVGFSGGSSSGSFPMDLIATPIHSEGRDNPLVSSVQIPMPQGSRITRKNPLDSRSRQIEFITRHSRLTIRFPTDELLEQIGKNAVGDGPKVLRRLGLTQGNKIYLRVLRVEIRLSQFKATRFSNQAERELEWMNSIAVRLTEELSWDSARKLVAQSQ